MEYILRTNTVSKKYTNYYAVDKVSISIKKGEIYGLIGENGAGKSTLMKMIAGLVEPSEGSIELFGNFVPQTERYRIGCVIELLWSSFFVTLRPNFHYRSYTLP